MTPRERRIERWLRLHRGAEMMNTTDSREFCEDLQALLDERNGRRRVLLGDVNEQDRLRWLAADISSRGFAEQEIARDIVEAIHAMERAIDPVNTKPARPVTLFDDYAYSATVRAYRSARRLHPDFPFHLPESRLGVEPS